MDALVGERRERVAAGLGDVGERRRVSNPRRPRIDRAVPVAGRRRGRRRPRRPGRDDQSSTVAAALQQKPRRHRQLADGRTHASDHRRRDVSGLSRSGARTAVRSLSTDADRRADRARTGARPTRSVSVDHAAARARAVARRRHSSTPHVPGGDQTRLVATSRLGRGVSPGSLHARVCVGRHVSLRTASAVQPPAADAARPRHDRARGRLRQRRQPAPRSRHRAAHGDGDPAGARRLSMGTRETPSAREPRARDGRRGTGTRVRDVGEPRAGRAHAHRRSAVDAGPVTRLAHGGLHRRADDGLLRFVRRRPCTAQHARQGVRRAQEHARRSGRQGTSA